MKKSLYEYENWDKTWKPHQTFELSPVNAVSTSHSVYLATLSRDSIYIACSFPTCFERAFSNFRNTAMNMYYCYSSRRYARSFFFLFKICFSVSTVIYRHVDLCRKQYSIFKEFGRNSLKFSRAGKLKHRSEKSISTGPIPFRDHCCEAILWICWEHYVTPWIIVSDCLLLRLHADQDYVMSYWEWMKFSSVEGQKSARMLRTPYNLHNVLCLRAFRTSEGAFPSTLRKWKKIYTSRWLLLLHNTTEVFERTREIF